MGLPSQSARGGGRGAGAVYSRRRKQGPFRAVVPFVIVLAVVAIVWFTVRTPGGPNAAGAGETQAAETGGADPVTIANSGTEEPERERGPRSLPTRALPGAETPAPADEEVDVALGVNDDRAGDREGNGLLSGAMGGGEEDSGARTEVPVIESVPVVRNGTTQGTPRGAGNSRVRLNIDTARRLMAENDAVGARALLSRVLREGGLDDAEASLVRDELTEINDVLVFGRVVQRGDPMCEEYTVSSGDSLSRIAMRRELATHWKLIQRVNRLRDPTRIRLGQTLKLVRGPFHAVVDKSDYRMDIFHGSPDDPSGWVYIRSFDVGLGEHNGTPVGSFVVSANKLENPGWVNPRDGTERYAPGDPDNPIGEFWLGLRGIGSSQDITGYGIHGTIEPESIGRSDSMGCVRLRDADIEVVFELLAEMVSRVDIVD